QEFIVVVGWSAVTLPLAARAQQAGVCLWPGSHQVPLRPIPRHICERAQHLPHPSDRQVRVRVLMNLAADDSEGKVRSEALLQALQELGWTDGRYGGRGVTARDSHGTDRVRDGDRPSRRWIRRKPSAPRWQHHRFYLVRIRHERQMSPHWLAGGSE